MNTLMTSSRQGCAQGHPLDCHKLRYINSLWGHLMQNLSHIVRSLRKGIQTSLEIRHYHTCCCIQYTGFPLPTTTHPLNSQQSTLLSPQLQVYLLSRYWRGGNKKKNTKSSIKDSVQCFFYYILHFQWNSTSEKSKRNPPFCPSYSQIPTLRTKFTFVKNTCLPSKKQTLRKLILSKTKHQQYLSKGTGILDRLMQGTGRQDWAQRS